MITIKQFEFNMFAENTYVLYDETKEAVIVDCGCMSTDEENRLSDFIARHELKPKHLLCTHLHVDHIIGNAFVHKTYGLSPQAHRLEVEHIPPLEIQMKYMGLSTPVHSPSVTTFLEENDLIRFGKAELIALLVPGHSPGSLAFYSPRDGFIISGDALFAGSIGRTDLWGGSFGMLISAIREKILSLPDETVIYSGHGPSTTVIEEKLNNPYL